MLNVGLSLTVAPTRGKPLAEARYEDNIDTTLIPPGAQYGAILGKLQKKRFRNAVLATLSKPLQCPTAHP
jgi:hypothetical protein